MGGVAEPVVPKGRSLLAVPVAQCVRVCPGTLSKLSVPLHRRTLSLVSPMSYAEHNGGESNDCDQATERPERLRIATASSSPGRFFVGNALYY